jgi:hypothetical protein
MHFHRTDMAKSIAKALIEPDMFSDIRNGLFLTAPRRTGKSMFLQHDLMPELSDRKYCAFMLIFGQIALSILLF